MTYKGDLKAVDLFEFVCNGMKTYPNACKEYVDFKPIPPPNTESIYFNNYNI
jgi:hypothetical protein